MVHAYNPSYSEAEIGGPQSKTTSGKSMRPYLKSITKKANGLGCSLCGRALAKQEALTSIPSNDLKERERRRGRG
jgi:hypothetical protein